MSILVQDLTKTYGSQKAIDGLSFRIPKGEIVGFLGPNGAGKSTTMKILTGYLLPTSGQAFVNDLDVSQEPMAVKRQLGYLPEHNPLYVEMYVREFLSFVGNAYGLTGTELKNRVEEMIETVGLTPERHKKIRQLSKGYRQRVGLAHALIHDPSVLILDEPTTGLDPNQLVEIRQLTKEVGRDKTVLLSTHIMQEVEAICQRAIIIHKGHLVGDVSLADLQQTGGSIAETFAQLTQ